MLMDLRSDADYNSDVFFDQEIAEELLVGVEQFNEAIMELIKRQIRIN
jgi:hypothetical protein